MARTPEKFGFYQIDTVNWGDFERILKLRLFFNMIMKGGVDSKFIPDLRSC
jgi:hypothetical protein